MAFCGYLKQSTAVDVLLGPFMDDGDGDTADTDATIDVELSKNGQALADSESAAPTHDAAGNVDGYYNCVLGTTDTNTLGILTVVAHHADDLPVRQDYQVVTANWFDSMCSTDKLDTSLVQILGTAVAESTGANIATNFNTFFDDGDDATSTAIMSYIEELAAANLPTDVAACATPAEVATALTDINLDHLCKTTTGVAADGDLSNHVVDGTILCHLMTTAADTDKYKCSTDSFQASRDEVAGGVTLGADAITAAKIADNAFSAEHFATNCLTNDALDATWVTEIWSKAMVDVAAGNPSATCSALVALNYLYEVWRNKTTTTATLITVMKDDGSTPLVKSTIGDDDTTFTKAEFVDGT